MNKNNKIRYISPMDKDKNKTRINTLSRMPGLKQEISTLAKEYNVDPRLIAYRLGHEGYLDEIARAMHDFKKDIDIHDKDLKHLHIKSFSNLGLDNSFDHLKTNKTKLHRYIPYVLEKNSNEHKRIVNTAETKSPIDKLELFVAHIAGIQQRAAKKGYTGENLIKATNRGFNAGEYSNLDINKYGLKEYSNLVFPKPKDYKKEYKDNNFNNVSINQALDYIQNVTEYNYDADTKRMYSDFGTYDMSEIPLRDIDFFIPIAKRTELENARKNLVLDKQKNFIKQVSNIKVKNENKNNFNILKRFTLSGNY